MIINLPQGIVDGDAEIEMADGGTVILTVWDEYAHDHAHIDLKPLIEFIAGHDLLKGLIPGKDGDCG